jgi:hypothetical protein
MIVAMHISYLHRYECTQTHACLILSGEFVSVDGIIFERDDNVMQSPQCIK